ncbi:hypothetical protein JOB18_024727 [Solea senegalensis]|uniref:Uncharacterized protein n=1 Tax=Solea senegalensis TaxID=28829 RepID=A0AAV6QFY8_SOLSE|nr:hypothetical protein JOB18_024727 [Solea senegalensis]
MSGAPGSRLRHAPFDWLSTGLCSSTSAPPPPKDCRVELKQIEREADGRLMSRASPVASEKPTESRSRFPFAYRFTQVHIGEHSNLYTVVFSINKPVNNGRNTLF